MRHLGRWLAAFFLWLVPAFCGGTVGAATFLKLRRPPVEGEERAHFPILVVLGPAATSTEEEAWPAARAGLPPYRALTEAGVGPRGEAFALVPFAALPAYLGSHADARLLVPPDLEAPIDARLGQGRGPAFGTPGNSLQIERSADGSTQRLHLDLGYNEDDEREYWYAATAEQATPGSARSPGKLPIATFLLGAASAPLLAALIATLSTIRKARRERAESARRDRVAAAPLRP
jgi:hypothetical protein